MFARVFFAIVFLHTIFSHGFSQVRQTKKFPHVEFIGVADNRADTLEFTAKVKTIYKCPPCPEGAQCKPCIGDHVEVTNGNPDLDFRVFTHQLSLFEIDKTYDFLVRFRSAVHRRDNIELLTSNPKK